MSLHARPSAVRRLAVALVLSSLALPSRARAASLGDEPLLDPKLEIDPRTELDPRIDLPDPPRQRRPSSPLRTPIWIGIGASYGTDAKGLPIFGAQLQLGVPLDRLAARGVRTAIAEDAHAPPGGPAPAPSSPSPPGRRKLDLTPPPPPPKIPIPQTAVPETPLRVPVVVTPAAAHAAVEAALRRAHLIDPAARMDALATRARQAAGLPELRLRVLRTADDGQTLSPVSYDPNRIVAVDTIRFWLEARATWRLDRLLFTEEEIALERMRQERADAQARLTKEVLRLLFDWQRARANVDDPNLSAEDNLSARLKASELAAELDILTDGWFGRWRAKQPEAQEAPRPTG